MMMLRSGAVPSQQEVGSMDDIEFISEAPADEAGRSEVVFGRGAWRLATLRTSNGFYFDADTLERFDGELQFELRQAFNRALTRP
jgi:hypothetical protein